MSFGPPTAKEYLEMQVKLQRMERKLSHLAALCNTAVKMGQASLPLITVREVLEDK